MSVRIQLNKKHTDNEQFVQIPINMDFSPLDRTDAINRDYVDVEVKKAINLTSDNEVDRLVITNIGTGITSQIDRLIINVNLNIDGLNRNTFLSDIGITSDDMKYQRNKLIRSFLKIEFFDSPNIKTQTKITEHTMFLYMLDEYFDRSNTNMLGNPKEPSVCRLRFKAYDPIKHLNNVGEGFNIYIPKKHVGTSIVKNKIYARFSFNSAVTGISHKLCVSQLALPVNELLNKLHVTYQTFKTNDGEAFYGIELNNIGSINILGVCELNLFECISI